MHQGSGFFSGSGKPLSFPDPLQCVWLNDESTDVSDVGIVTLPDGRSFAVAVFIAGDRTGAEVRDRVIADMARAAYDYYRLVDA